MTDVDTAPLTIDPDFAGVVKEDAGMVKDARIARAEFQSSHVTTRVQRNRQDEVSKHIRAVSGDAEWNGHADDNVWNTELPSVCEDRNGRPVLGIALLEPVLHPAPERVDLAGLQTTLAGKFTFGRFGLPGRHDVHGRGRGDQTCTLPRVVIGQETERRGFPGPMAGGAVGVKDRGHVAIERDRRTRLRPHGSLQRDGRHQTRESEGRRRLL